MNAGAHGKEIKDIVKSVRCIDYEGKEKEFTNKELKFKYKKKLIIKFIKNNFRRKNRVKKRKKRRNKEKNGRIHTI